MDRFDFQDQRIVSHQEEMQCDLRGFVPMRSLGAMLRWFNTGADRETASECLHRELVEELIEVGHNNLAADLVERQDALAFTHVRTVREGPRHVDGQPYRQMRHIEVYDLAIVNEFSARLLHKLIGLSRDPQSPGVISATRAEIMSGWYGRAFISPHSAYLEGKTKPAPDQLPPS